MQSNEETQERKEKICNHVPPMESVGISHPPDLHQVLLPYVFF